MKTKILILAILLLANIGYSQNFIYSYDAAGNRVKRAVKISTKMEVFTDSTFADVGEQLIAGDVISDEFSNQTDESKTFRTILYPNPTNGLFTVELPEFKQGESGYIIIYNQMGNMVEKQNYVSSTQSFDITSLSSGFYIVHIIVNGKLVVRKIIKQ